MPRSGPRRSFVGFKLAAELVAEVDQCAETEKLIGPKGEPNRSEMIRIFLLYALQHMPRGWRPAEDDKEAAR